MKRSKEGFTLAELLIVVAIIAILVSISIPIFNSQLEKSRRAVDEYNARLVYSAIVSAYSSGDLVLNGAGCITLFVYNEDNKTKSFNGIDAGIGSVSGAAAGTTYKGMKYSSFPKIKGNGGATVSMIKAICADYGLDVDSMISKQKKNTWFAVQVSFEDGFKSGYAEGTGTIQWVNNRIPEKYFTGGF